MSSFTMTTHQIWSCHVTLAANSENFYFWPTSILNLGKLLNLGKIGLIAKTLRTKTKRGVENTSPSQWLKSVD